MWQNPPATASGSISLNLKWGEVKMKIRYRHIANTNADGEVEEKIHDTEKSFRNCVSSHRVRSGEMDQEKWDQFTLEKFKTEFERGIVLSYEVLNETPVS